MAAPSRPLRRLLLLPPHRRRRCRRRRRPLRRRRRRRRRRRDPRGAVSDAGHGFAAREAAAWVGMAARPLGDAQRHFLAAAVEGRMRARAAELGRTWPAAGGGRTSFGGAGSDEAAAARIPGRAGGPARRESPARIIKIILMCFVCLSMQI